MCQSDIVAIVSVITACVSAVVPQVLSFIRWRSEAKRDFAEIYRSDALENWLSASSACIDDPFTPGNLPAVLFAYSRCAYYVNPETAVLMKAFCDAAMSAKTDPSKHTISERADLFDRVVLALYAEPLRKLPHRRYRHAKQPVKNMLGN